MDEDEDEDVEETYEYFAPDRLAGVVKGFVDLDGDESILVVELIHLTARFGAFKREGKRWETIWQGWNPDPDYFYINFKTNEYDNVVRAFDSHEIYGLQYSTVKEYREVRDWEGTFDKTKAPHYFRSIEEIINQIQDFVEPRPEIITYGSGRVGCGDMAWMHPFVVDLQQQREDLENFVLAQKRQPHETLMAELLLRIEMYPPLHDELITLFTAAANHIDDLEEFEELYEGTSFMNYFNGQRISINQLQSYSTEFIALVVGHQSALTKQRADSFRLTRDINLIPTHRLEAWFVGPDNKFFQIVANTEFGLFSSVGQGKWRPLFRDYEVEDIFDFMGVKKIHIRPERERSAITQSVQGGFAEKLISDHAFIRYQVEYRGEKSSIKDFFARITSDRKPKVLFKSLKRIASTVVSEMIYELRTDMKLLVDENLHSERLIQSQLILENFLANKIDLSLRELHDLLATCFYEDLEEGNGVQQLADQIRKKNESRLKFEKLMERRDVEYLPLSSMVLVVAYQPSVRMWLEYRSHYYGRFARRAGEWKTNIQQNSEIYKELFLYEVKEERANDFVVAFDAISSGEGSASFAEIAPMLSLLRMDKNADLTAVSNDDWDTEPFTHKQMQTSTMIVFDALYDQIQRHFEDKADSYQELSQEQLAAALLNDREELSAIYGDEARKFVRKGEFFDREHLSRFMSGAEEILTSHQSAGN